MNNNQTFTLKSSDLGGQLSNAHYANGMGFSGENQSPSLHWENAPAETKSFAVTMHDLDAPTGSGFWHWVVFDIPSTTSSLVAGAGAIDGSLLPSGAVQSNTDMGAPGYVGAAPSDGRVHRYLLTVHAVDKKLELGENVSPAFVGFNLNFSTLAKASLLVYGQQQ